MSIQNKTIPASALQFLAPASISTASETAAGRTLAGVAYSGDVVTDHGYWERLVIDLATVSLAPPVPLLHGHDANSSVGAVTDAVAATDLKITADLFTKLDPLAASIADKADAGFPWQLSVGIWPSSIEEVKAGASVQLNGRSFTGPLTVFKGGRIREVSVVALGADHQTSAAVLNAGQTVEIPYITNEGDTMDLSEAQARITALETQLAAGQTASAELTALRAELDAEKEARLAAEAKVKENEANVRLSAIVGLQTELGAEWPESAISLLKGMTDDQFNFYAGEMRTSRKSAKLAAGLTTEIATGGAEPADDAARLAAASATLLKQVGGK
jgi:hypothetical protein